MGHPEPRSNPDTRHALVEYEFTPQEDAEAIAAVVQTERELGIYRAPVPIPPPLVGPAWATHYFPHAFNRPFAEYQKDFWNWGWTIEPDTYIRPRVECEPRGVGKSTGGEALVASLVARKKKKMIGYVSLEEDKAGKHFDSIKNLLEHPTLLADFPHCRPKVAKLKNSAAQWSRDAIITASDAMIVPLSMQGSSRGWKSPTNERFDMFVLDDIDKLGMSPAFVAKLLELLKGEILAAGDDQTLVLVLQNLIHRDSIVSQILDHRADILSDRIFKGPYPLLTWYDAEKVDIAGDTNGAKQWIITAGDAYDPAISLEYANKLLNKFGKATFDRECQQDVKKVGDDRDFREWDEVYHIITYSEFRQFFRENGVEVWNPHRNHPLIPQNWNVGLGMDWGTTVGHPTAVAAIARPNEGAPLDNSFFAFTEVVLPHFPIITGEDVPLVSPGRVAKAIKDALAEWNVKDNQIKQHLMSHEASAALNTMRVDLADDLKTFFNKWQARKGSGVPQIQNLLEIDYNLLHPFRLIEGRPRLYFVVPDDQGKMMLGDLDRLMVAQPKDYKGFARARYEMPLYSQLNGGQNKIDDDYVDALRGLMNVFGVKSQIMPPAERRERALPEHLQNRERIMTETPEQAERLMLARSVAFAQMDKKDAAGRAVLSKVRPQVPKIGMRRGR
jgi:hypothetical protein